MLEELRVNEEFDLLVGRVARTRVSQYPRLIAIALLLRQSWWPQDLERTAVRVCLRRELPPITSDSVPDVLR